MPELITGTKGTPHVTSTQDRSIYEKIIGKGSYILDDNELLEPELQSNQSLRIRSGMLYHHGSITEVKRNTYDEVTIANGSQEMKRIDLVVARYTKNPETEIEEMNWVVIQGTPAASDPATPAYTEGNMQEGDLTDDCPVFEVHLDGIQVTEVVKLLKVLEGSLESLNSNNIIESGHNDNGYWRKYGDGTLEMWDDTLISGVNINSQDGWNYYASGSKTIMMPVKSLTYVMPVVTARGECAPWVSVPGAGLGTDRFLAWIYASTSNANVNVWLSWRCFGTWK